MVAGPAARASAAAAQDPTLNAGLFIHMWLSSYRGGRKHYNPAVRSKEVHLVERPQGLPTPAQFAIVDTEVGEPADGQLLVQNIYMSVDPAMRPRLAGQTPLNVAMASGAVGRVLKSRHSGFKEGDTVQSMQGFRQYFVADGTGITKLDAEGIPLAAHMSVLGLTGLTAYGGLLVTAALRVNRVRVRRCGLAAWLPDCKIGRQCDRRAGRREMLAQRRPR